MVMRGLPVPREKRLYILRDTKREAERLGMPFGRIADPVGVPTERGLAVLHHAMAADKGPEFLWSFLRGVWAEGIDAGSDSGLRTIAARAGLGETCRIDSAARSILARGRKPQPRGDAGSRPVGRAVLPCRRSAGALGTGPPLGGGARPDRRDEGGASRRDYINRGCNLR